MANTPIDKNGNVHGENGQFVSLRGHIESIMDEREKMTERVFADSEKAAEFKRVALEKALDRAKLDTDKAMVEAKAQVEQKLSDAKSAADKGLSDAKNAADEVNQTMKSRLDKLESGGAPFASRLDEGLTKLRSDVETLNTQSVKATVLDALREQAVQDTKAQKRQIKYIAIAAAGSFLTSLLLFVARYLS